jgi:hypothetical protein
MIEIIAGYRKCQGLPTWGKICIPQGLKILSRQKVWALGVINGKVEWQYQVCHEIQPLDNPELEQM